LIDSLCPHETFLAAANHSDSSPVRFFALFVCRERLGCQFISPCGGNIANRCRFSRAHPDGQPCVRPKAKAKEIRRKRSREEAGELASGAWHADGGSEG